MPLEGERIGRGDDADGGSTEPERQRRVLQHEPTGGRAGEESDLPREARERHEAADQARLREVGDERRVNRAVETFAKREGGDRQRERERCRPPVEPVADGRDPEERDPPDDAHQREPAHPAPSLDELYDGQLRERDDERYLEPEDADRALAHVRRVLRERRQELARDGDPGADEDDVERDIREEGAVAEHVGVAARLRGLFASRCRNETQDRDEDEERCGVDQEEDRERAGVSRARDQAGNEAAERESEVHRHPLLGECGVPARRRRQQVEQRRLARPKRPTAGAGEHVERERVPRRAHEREECERHRHHHERSGEDGAGAEAIGERAADERRHEPCE